MLREALAIVTTGVALAPAMMAARIVDAARGNVRQSLGALGISAEPSSVVRLKGGHSSAVFALRFAETGNDRQGAKAQMPLALVGVPSLVATWIRPRRSVSC